MIRNDITPLTDLSRRAPEAGRIRLGEKTGKGMRSLDTFRFTSPARDVIDQLAALYGGTVTAWNEPKANPSNQWQVTTTADEIPVYLVPDGISVFYETWSGGGVQRRCDGVSCEMPEARKFDYEMVQVPCLCRAEGVRSCRPYSRLQVIIPQVSFRGVWRLETKGWNAATELPGMYDMIVDLTQAGRYVQARLGIERREQMTVSGKRKFVVPRLSIEQTVHQLQAGDAAVGAIGAAAVTVATPALAAVPVAAPVVSDEIADAEVVDDELLELEDMLRADARNYGLDEERYVAAVRRQTNDDRERMRVCSSKVRAEQLVPMAFKPDGSVQWGVPS